MSQALQRNSLFAEVQADLMNNARHLMHAIPRVGGVDDVAQKARVLRSIRGAMSAFRTVPKLLDCDRGTLIGSVIQACQLGLELDPVMGQAYLVPYRETCQMQVGYKGLILLALRSGFVSSISAEVVYQRDDFDFQYGTDAHLHHKPYLGPEDPGPMVCIYAQATMTDGSRVFRVMTLRQADSIRDAALKRVRRDDTPWKAYPEEMYRKTAVRNLAKYLPKTVEAHYAAVRDEAIEAGAPPSHPTWADVEPPAQLGAPIPESVDRAGDEAFGGREPGQEG